MYSKKDEEEKNKGSSTDYEIQKKKVSVSLNIIDFPSTNETKKRKGSIFTIGSTTSEKAEKSKGSATDEVQKKKVSVNQDTINYPSINYDAKKRKESMLHIPSTSTDMVENKNIYHFPSRDESVKTKGSAISSRKSASSNPGISGRRKQSFPGVEGREGIEMFESFVRNKVTNMTAKQSLALTEYSYVSGTTPPHNLVHIDVDVEYFEESKEEERGNWWHYSDFLLAAITSSVGLGNMWLFPYLCYKNGGGAFLVPYLLCIFIIGIPMICLEISLGQYMSFSTYRAWDIVPFFQGLGLASAFISTIVSVANVVVISWVFFYTWQSIDSRLPWTTCQNFWNTKNCSNNWKATELEQKYVFDPATEFWENRALMINDGKTLGGLNADLMLNLAISWILVYFSIAKGMRMIGQLSHFVVLAPYILMTVLIVHNLTLDGALDGLNFYITIDSKRLFDATIWRDALTQVFFSSGIGIGVMICVGSYQPFFHNSYRDSIIISSINFASSFLAGLVVFSCIGFMAKQQGKSLTLVAESGPGLIFITYPTAVSSFPFAPVWSLLFFLMLFFFALDSQFIITSSLITIIIDQHPRRLRKQSHILGAIVCLLSFFAGVPMVCEGGVYVYTLLLEYTEFVCLPFIALLECVALMYVYGAKRFEENIAMMIGDSWLLKTLPYLRFCWCVLDPLLCITMYTFKFERLSYSRPHRPVYYHPGWMLNIGRGIVALALLCLPLVICIKLKKYGLSLRLTKLMFRPYHLHPHQLRPGEEPVPCLKDVNEAVHPHDEFSSGSDD